MALCYVVCMLLSSGEQNFVVAALGGVSLCMYIGTRTTLCTSWCA